MSTDLYHFIGWLNEQTEFTIDPVSTVDPGEVVASYQESLRVEYDHEPSVMDRPDYWDFVESTPPSHLYDYEVVEDDDNHRFFTVCVNANDGEQAEMRAVQVARHLGSPDPISGGATPTLDERHWYVQIEAW